VPAGSESRLATQRLENNMIKSLLLGAAAGLVAVSAASAADLPAKAKPVDYVKVCSQYGEGFFVIPGTDTCLDIGGYVRVDYYVEDDTNTANTSRTKTRAQLNLDARSQTSHGTLRSFIELRYEIGSGAGAQIRLNRAFIQWAGFTFGRALSMFDFYDSANVYGIDSATQGSGQTTTVLAYTMEFGNGWGATISLEDGTFRRTNPAAFYAGHEFPDIVAAVTYDQSWGSFKASFAARQLKDAAGVFDQWGLAYQLGASFKVGQGTLWLQAAYADGAVSYSGYGMHGMNLASSTIEVAATGETAESWSVVAAYTQPIGTTLEFNIFASYGEYELSAVADEKTWHIGGSLAWTPVKNLTFANQIEYLRVDTVGLPDADDWRYLLSVQRSF
jgi:hypothetical protein